MRLLAAVAAALACFLVTVGATSSSSSSSMSSSRSSSSSSSYSTPSAPRGVTTYTGSRPPTPGSKVVVTQSSSQTQVAKVPQPQKVGGNPTTATFSKPVVPAQQPQGPLLAGTNKRYVYVPPVYRSGTPYSPSGYTLPSGRAAVWSPVSHSYVEVHHYYYSDWGIGAWHPYYGYYGCLTCWDGPYAYAPVPLPGAPAEWSQPSWAYDLEAAVVVLLVLGGAGLLIFWLGRRRSRREPSEAERWYDDELWLQRYGR